VRIHVGPAVRSLGSPRTLAKTTVLAIALVMSSGMLVAASIPDSTSGVISACYTKAAVRIIDAQAGESCKKGETLLAWSQQGPRGLQGPPGPASLATLQDTACTRHDGTTGFVDITTDSDNVITFTCAFGIPHWCDTHTPIVGPHLNVTCDEAADTLAFICDIGWVNFDTDIANGCEAEGFEPTAAAVQAFAEFFILGSHDVSVVPVCTGDITIACPGGTPSDPAPVVHITGSNLVIQDGLAGQFTISLHVSIQASGIPISGSGIDCSLAIDTAAGTYPNTTVTGVVSFESSVAGGVTDVIVTSNGAVNQLENEDVSISGGILCAAADALKAFALSTIEATFEGYLDQSICRAPDPAIFEICPPAT
jgi:hypothetical protein